LTLAVIGGVRDNEIWDRCSVLGEGEFGAAGEVVDAGAGAFVFVRPKRLEPDPKDNAGELLAYANGGLFNQLGRVWMCWGICAPAYEGEGSSSLADTTAVYEFKAVRGIERALDEV